MDFTFLMFVLSAGVLIGSYFVYWHIENLITDRNVSLMHDMESLFSGWRHLIREDIDLVRESLEKCKVECSKMKNDMEYIKELMTSLSKVNTVKQTEYKPARKTSMKLKEKSSSDDGD